MKLVTGRAVAIVQAKEQASYVLQDAGKKAALRRKHSAAGRKAAETRRRKVQTTGDGPQKEQ